MRCATGIALSIASVLIAGCSASDGVVGSSPTAEASQAATVPPALQFVKDNAAVDEQLHLLARQFVNNQTEVISFYEPYRGHIVAVGAGNPTGHAQLSPVGLLGQAHSAEELWHAVAPGQIIPTALLDGIGRQLAGVGDTELVTTPAGASESVASFQGVEGAPSAAEVAGGGALTARPAVTAHDTGWCDSVWESDFNPSTMTGVCADTEPNELNLGCTSGGGYYAPFGSQAYPYNSAGCECSGRTVQGFRAIDTGSASSHSSNEWENFATACASNGPATLTVSGSWNAKWTVGTNSFLWIQDVGTVTCFISSCTSTHDIPSFNVTAQGSAQVSYLAEAYGP